MKLFIDFDGVLNSIPLGASFNKIEKKTGFTDFQKTYLSTADSEFLSTLQTEWKVWYSDERNRLLREMAEFGDLIWLTTWIPCIKPVQELTSIQGRLPLDPKNQVLSGYMWKQNVLLENVEPDEPFIWIDDDAISKQFADSYAGVGLCITPDYRFGLTKFDFDIMGEFIDGYY